MMKDPGAFRTISEVAKDLDLPQHVLRFWETRFAQIKPMKRGGGRRYYRPEDVDLLRGIRFLLYSDGFTIRGVQRLLKEKGLAFVVAVGQGGSMQAAAGRKPAELDTELPAEIEAQGEFSDIGSVEDDAVEPPFAAAVAQFSGQQEPSRAQAPPPVVGLSKEGRRKLESALSELVEAKRLLDQVR